jgi:hypothetical protein
MTRKRTTTEGFIECPFDEEDIISSTDYESILNQTNETPNNQNASQSTNLFYFQSKTNET